MRHRAPFFLAFFLAASAGPLAAQDPVGREVAVNQTRAGTQWAPEVGVAADGSFVVVWEDEQEGRVRARRYQSDGKPRGGELRVSRRGDRQQSAPALAVYPDGSFVVVWNRVPDGGRRVEVYASRFGADGQPLGQPRLVGFAGQDSAYERASVTTLPDGDFFVAWSLEDGGTYWNDGDIPSRDIYGRRFTRGGVLVGERVTLNGDSFGDQSLPQCAVSRGEELVCTWQGGLGEGSFGDAFLRRFDLDGLPLGEELQVNPPATEFKPQLSPNLAVNEDGAVLVVWEEGQANHSLPYLAMGRLLDASDRFLSPEFRVTTAPGPQFAVQAAAAGKGFVTAWSSGTEVLLRRLSADGTFTSGARRVSQRRDRRQAQVALVLGPGGGAVTWTTYTQNFADGEIAVRRLR